MNRTANCTIEFWDELTPEEYPYPFAIVIGQEILGFASVEDRFKALASPYLHEMIIRNSSETKTHDVSGDCEQPDRDRDGH